VLGSSRDDKEVAGFEGNFAIVLELDSESAVNDEEHFVLTVVGMPHELSEELRNLYVLIVDTTNHPWSPVLLDEVEFLDKPCPIKGFHRLRVRALTTARLVDRLPPMAAIARSAF